MHHKGDVTEKEEYFELLNTDTRTSEYNFTMNTFLQDVERKLLSPKGKFLEEESRRNLAGFKLECDKRREGVAQDGYQVLQIYILHFYAQDNTTKGISIWHQLTQEGNHY